MAKKEVAVIVPEEKIINQILTLRGEKVMLDLHLAALYGVETRALKQAVRRNPDLFPKDFMFGLNAREIDVVIAQGVIPSKQHLGGSTPFAFTEAGVAMLASVLKSKRAKAMNIAVVRAFVALRKIMLTHTELRSEIEMIRQEVDKHGKNIDLVFQYLDQLLSKKEEPQPRAEIGFRTKKKE